MVRLANVTPCAPFNVVCLLGRQARKINDHPYFNIEFRGKGGVADISKAEPYQSEVKYCRRGIAVFRFSCVRLIQATISFFTQSLFHYHGPFQAQDLFCWLKPFGERVHYRHARTSRVHPGHIQITSGSHPEHIWSTSGSWEF